MSSLGNRHNQHTFAQTPAVKMARSVFDRSHGCKDTFNFDYLIPIFWDEIIPGDSMSVSGEVFARLSTQLVPIMDNIYLDFFFFFVPNRLIWSNWEKFCGAQDNPGDSTSFIIPYLTTFAAGLPHTNTIFDKFGLPTDLASGLPSSLKISAMPFRAYNKIYNQWFRDENLQSSAPDNTGDGPDSNGDFSLRLRGKRHDYFTSCLPNPQKATALSIPLVGNVPLTRINNGGATVAYNAGANTLANAGAVNVNAAGGRPLDNSAVAIGLDVSASMQAALATGTAGTINALRTAMQLQSFYELDNRGGTRYVEILQNHFNVTSPDFRLQRAEYLGGGQSRINCHPVAQTSPTSGSNYQAQLASFGTSAGSGIGFSKSFVEHGYVIGMVCARADISYQQGINKMFTRSSRVDFFWPKFQEIGEQAVSNQELYVDGVHDASVFGYQERYAEYRFRQSEIHGQFRSNYSAPLDYWHMAEAFGSVPPLDGTFISQNTPITRALANSSAIQILFDSFWHVKHARPMMTYSVPASLGRF